MLTPKIPNRVSILKEKFAKSAGLPFRELLPQSTIQQVIDELKIKYYRRIFDPFVTIWAFLSQVLDAEKSGSFVLGVLNLSKNKLKTIVGLTLQPLLISKRYSLLKFKP